MKNHIAAATLPSLLSPHPGLFTLPILLALLMAAAPVSAQHCQPMLADKRFTLVIPYGPGGGNDAYGRVFAAQFEVLTGSVMRIRNLPGAGTMIGINAVAEADSSDLVLGLFNLTGLLNDRILGRDSPEMSSLALLGSLYTDRTVWVTRADNPVDFDSAELRVFAQAGNTDFTRILLPGIALGWDIRVIRGYSGSSEGLFALLRRDVDYFYSGSTSLANQIRSLEGLEPLLSLTDEPNPLFPGVAHLAGAGGKLEELLNGLSAQQQQERRKISALVVELAKTYRAISVSAKADPALVTCLGQIVEAAAFSDGLRTAAEKQNLMVEPISGADLQAEIRRTEALIDSNWNFLQEMVARSR